MSEASARLSQAGVAHPRRDVEVLACHRLGVNRAYLFAHPERPLGAAEVDWLLDAVARRTRFEPVAYITGVREFWSLDFEVSRDVLIPRPSTEALVAAVLEVAAEHPGARLLDIGTGSGAIAVALARELATAEVVATDVSEAALGLAARNAQRHGVSARVGLRAGNLFEPLAATERFDVIASNPPYIRVGDWEGLMRDVRDHEPRQALLGGDDGLAFIGPIVRGAPAHLVAGGHLFVEVGHDQDVAVEALMREAGFEAIVTRRDTEGLQRVVSGRRGLTNAEPPA